MGVEKNIWAYDGRGNRGVGKNYIVRSLMICTAHPTDDHSEKKEIGGTCSMFAEEERRIQGLRWGNLRERDNLGDLGVVRGVILRWIFRK